MLAKKEEKRSKDENTFVKCYIRRITFEVCLNYPQWKELVKIKRIIKNREVGINYQIIRELKENPLQHFQSPLREIPRKNNSIECHRGGTS